MTRKLDHRRGFCLIFSMLLWVLALTGCGGSGGEASKPSSEEGVRDAYLSYQMAILNGDYETACDLQTPEGQAESIEDTNSATGAEATDCPSAMRAFWEDAPTPSDSEVESDIMDNSRVDFISDYGDVAHIAQSNQAPTYWFAYLKLVDGKWLVTSEEDAKASLPQ